MIIGILADFPSCSKNSLEEFINFPKISPSAVLFNNERNMHELDLPIPGFSRSFNLANVHLVIVVD